MHTDKDGQYMIVFCDNEIPYSPTYTNKFIFSIKIEFTHHFTISFGFCQKNSDSSQIYKIKNSLMLNLYNFSFDSQGKSLKYIPEFKRETKNIYTVILEIKWKTMEMEFQINGDTIALMETKLQFNEFPLIFYPAIEVDK